jgi:CRP-like cAMP-binding protein
MKEWLPTALHAVGVERKLDAGQMLFRRGGRSVGLYEIVSGNVRLVRTDYAGRDVVLHTAAAGDTIAEASLFSSTYHCDAIATTDAIVRVYPKSVMLAELERNPKAMRAFMATICHQVMDLRTRLEQRNIRSARDRVRHYLTAKAGADGRTVALSGTLKDLALELGLSPEALYRTLADMTADGEIERREGKILRT